MIGERLRSLRESKNFSQGHLEERTGLLRCYISRVENGHTVPALETLEKFARALEVPLYHVVYDGPEPPSADVLQRHENAENLWGSARHQTRQLRKLVGYLTKMTEADRRLLMAMAQHAANRGASRRIEKH